MQTSEKFKICTGCNETKLMNYFSPKDGGKRRAAKCNTCEARRKKDRYKQVKRSKAGNKAKRVGYISIEELVFIERKISSSLNYSLLQKQVSELLLDGVLYQSHNLKEKKYESKKSMGLPKSFGNGTG